MTHTSFYLFSHTFVKRKENSETIKPNINNTYKNIVAIIQRPECTVTYARSSLSNLCLRSLTWKRELCALKGVSAHSCTFRWREERSCREKDYTASISHNLQLSRNLSASSSTNMLSIPLPEIELRHPSTCASLHCGAIIRALGCLSSALDDSEKMATYEMHFFNHLCYPPWQQHAYKPQRFTRTMKNIQIEYVLPHSCRECWRGS